MEEELIAVSRFLNTYNFSDEEIKLLKSYDRRTDLLYKCFINTDLELTDDNLYIVFKNNF